MDDLAKLVSDEAARELEPHEFIATFDPGTWATVRSLITVLRRKGVLSDADCADVVTEMSGLAGKHEERGETDLAAAVREVEKQLARLTSDTPG